MARRLPAPDTLSPLYHLFAASQRAGTLLAEALAGAPLDAAGYALYSGLRETQPTTPTELARHLGMPTTTVLDALAGMARNEHVVKLRHPRDGRSYLIRLTDAGEDVHDETHSMFSKADTLLLARLGAQRRQVISALEDLKQASESALEDLRVTQSERTG